jgi:tetratricopeptide (TPR) repeat protein
MLPPLDSVGCLALCQGDRDTARALFQEYLAVAQERNDPSDLARAIVQRGRLAEAAGNYPGADVFFKQAITGFRELDEPSRLMGTLSHHGWVLRQQKDYPGAAAAFSELLALSQKQRWSGSAVTPLCLLGEVAGDQGDWERAAACHAEGLRRCRADDGRHPQALPQCLSGMARVALARGRPVRAARLLGATFALWTERGPSAWEIEPRARRDRDRNLAAARAQLETAEFAAAWAEGQAMSTEQAIAEGLEEAPAG